MEPSQFRSQAEGEITSAMLAMGILGAGGVRWFTTADAQIVEGEPTRGEQLGFGLKDAIDRLGKMEGELSGLNPPGEAEIARRVSQYGQSSYTVWQEVRRHSHVRVVDDEEAPLFTHEQNILDAFVERHCSECPELSDLGWQPIGTLPPIGLRECGSNDRCHFEFTNLEESEVVNESE